MNLQSFGHFLVPAVSAILGLIGVAAVVRPAQSSRGFGVEASGSALDYVRGMGVRDIFLGGTVILLFLKAQFGLLAYAFLGLALVSLVDFVIVARHRSKQAFIHACGGVGSFILAIWILLTWN